MHLRALSRRISIRRVVLNATWNLRLAHLSSSTLRPIAAPSRPLTASQNTGVKIFDESISVVKVNDKDDGESFYCDEEPHMLGPEHGHGYHPILLGDRLDDGKFQVVRKLGWAGYSSVWLARVLNVDDISSIKRRYVALKVLTVNATCGVMDGLLPEDKSFGLITRTNPNNPGYEHCLTLHRFLLLRSKHGPHFSFVTHPLGSDLTTLQLSQPNGRFALRVVKRIIKQTLLALDYMHRECGLVHTDVKAENILVDIGNADNAIEEEIKRDPSTTYEPRFEPDLSPDPIVTVKSQPLPNFGLRQDLSNLNIKLVDYGSAISVLKGPAEGEIQPVLLRAPEVILGQTWSTPVDIWSVGCLVFEYLTATALFQIYESPAATFADVHLRRMTEVIGPFPRQFLERCKGRESYFDDEGALLRLEAFVPRSLEQCLANYGYNPDDKDIIGTADFMRRCLTIDPNARPSALELLSDEWLRGT